MKFFPLKGLVLNVMMLWNTIYTFWGQHTLNALTVAAAR
jgi:hypothetical protein